ncbi:MAG: hypothetical protein AB8H86_17530 [Polyangiales bacterium]
MLRLQRKRRSRGAAYAEACVMIPVFITIIWAYHLLYNANVARGTAMMNARSQAWELSMAGCTFFEGGSCEGSGCADGAAVGDGLSGSGWIMDILGPIFGPNVSGASSVDYEVGGTPWGLMSGGAASADVSLVCNTKRQTLWMILKEAICNVPGLGSFLDFISFC